MTSIKRLSSSAAIVAAGLIADPIITKGLLYRMSY